ncbi:hypothetical protein B1B05_05015 [Domibacillus enclensis]|uniref:Uncharacterized protein n=1 Tax=Domibacillus enclensis TaxID=1017273 RepID=A0ABX4EAW4_9BACI|nr:hypothetical protein B1B05_05015 [Domibacillus enclensis]
MTRGSKQQKKPNNPAKIAVIRLSFYWSEMHRMRCPDGCILMTNGWIIDNPAVVSSNPAIIFDYPAVVPSNPAVV